MDDCLRQAERAHHASKYSALANGRAESLTVQRSFILALPSGVWIFPPPQSPELQRPFFDPGRQAPICPFRRTF
jgi:hypothetical protein